MSKIAFSCYTLGNQRPHSLCDQDNIMQLMTKRSIIILFLLSVFIFFKYRVQIFVTMQEGLGL